MPSHFPSIDSLSDFLVKMFTRGFGMDAPLKNLKSWSPFRLDALGLLTMLGADEMSREIGSLSANTLVSWLSLLGGNVVPSNAFMDPLHGFTLYNISDAIQSTTLAGWFSRWLLAQHPSQNTSIFEWKLRSQPPPNRYRAPAIGAIVNTCIVTLPLLVGDYYGLASALCMNVGVTVRAYLVKQNLEAIDRAAIDTSTYPNDPVRTFVILANGKATTVIAPRNVVVNCFMSTPKVAHPTCYAIARAIGWFAFVGLIIAIGQAVLVVQVAIIIVTVSATVLMAFGIGTVGDGVGKSLQVIRFEHPNRHGRRGEAYAMLNLTDEEENTMVDWALFPQRRNKDWWNQYKNYQRTRSELINVFEGPTKAENLNGPTFTASTMSEEKFATTTAND